MYIFFVFALSPMKFIVPLRLLPTFRGQKNQFFFYLTKLNLNILPNFSIKKTSETFESTRVIYKKRIFKKKLVNQVGVIISDLDESHGGIFAATAHVGARSSCCSHNLFTSRFLQNSRVKALCFWKNLCSWKNQKRKEVPRKENRKQAQRRKKEYHSVKKRKIFLCESDWYWRSSMLASRFRLKKSPLN